MFLLLGLSQHHEPVLQGFVEGCGCSHLELNIRKTYEMVVTFSNKQRDLVAAVATIIHGTNIYKVQIFGHQL